jgi:hypothetical protein
MIVDKYGNCVRKCMWQLCGWGRGDICRDIFMFDGGSERLRSVTDLCCQCQISQRRS